VEPPRLNEREQQGLIKAYEYTFELAWNTLRDLLRSQGDATLLGSRDTLREAFRLGLIEDGEAWMLMIQDRNLTSYTYNHATAQAIPGIPEQAQARLIQLLISNPELQAVWLFGSRAIGRHQHGSDIDLCLEAPQRSAAADGRRGLPAAALAGGSDPAP
jgi:nucleotidyltransferase substrate binding protein (TIGR01987 family)